MQALKIVREEYRILIVNFDNRLLIKISNNKIPRWRLLTFIVTNRRRAFSIKYEQNVKC
jgi:hypothetical protein